MNSNACVHMRQRRGREDRKENNRIGWEVRGEEKSPSWAFSSCVSLISPCLCFLICKSEKAVIPPACTYGDNLMNPYMSSFSTTCHIEVVSPGTLSPRLPALSWSLLSYSALSIDSFYIHQRKLKSLAPHFKGNSLLNSLMPFWEFVFVTEAK